MATGVFRRPAWYPHFARRKDRRASPPPATYTLTAEAGAYSLTGVAAGVRADRRIAGAVGTYSLTGVAAGLRAARRLAGDQGTYSLTGVAADLVDSGAVAPPYTPPASVMSRDRRRVEGDRRLL